jgi:hypothetical protein
MELGSATVRLAPEGVRIVPGLWQRLRGAKPQLMPYEALVGVSLKEPQGLTRGELTLRGRRSNDTLTVRFGGGEVAEMHQVATELWQRIRSSGDQR